MLSIVRMMLGVGNGNPVVFSLCGFFHICFKGGKKVKREVN